MKPTSPGGLPAASGSKPEEGIGRLCELPPFLGVAVKVMQMSARENTDFRILAELLGSDPAFSAGLLRIANSPLFPVRTRVETVLQAATLVGIDSLKAMALTAGVRSYFGDRLTRAHIRRCWTHSLVSAMVAQFLAADSGVPPDGAYTASLLHDIGRLGLVKAYPRSYEPLLEKRFQDIDENLLEEAAVAGMTHCAAGGALMRAWAFPDDLILAAESHHSDACSAGISDLVRASCLCADFLGYGEIDWLRPLTSAELTSALPGSAGYVTLERLEDLHHVVRERLNAMSV